jgi:hypothetical protein
MIRSDIGYTLESPADISQIRLLHPYAGSPVARVTRRRPRLAI